MHKASNLWRGVIVLAVAHCLLPANVGQTPAQPQQKPRRSHRVGMQEVQVTSPDGKIKFTVPPNAERLTYTVTVGNTTAIEASPIIMKVDGYDLSSGVVFGAVEPYTLNETYPWYGAHSTATNQCNGAKISLEHDLSFTKYVLEVRAFNDGVAFRHVIPGEAGASRMPDEYSAFVVPSGSTVWYGGVEDGHYETEYKKKNISEVQAGEWGSSH